MGTSVCGWKSGGIAGNHFFQILAKKSKTEKHAERQTDRQTDGQKDR